MKYVKLLLISAVIFFLIVTGISLVIPSHVRISRAANIAPGNDTVLAQICDLNNWRNWHPQLENVLLKDTVSANGKLIQANANGVHLSVLKCTQNQVIVEMKKGERPLVNNWVLIKHGANDSLTLQNYIDFHFNWYPWEKFSSLMLEGSYGPVMEQGLRKLAK